MKMRAAQNVSFPRSGHSAVHPIVEGYFGDSFVYCDVDDPAYCGCGSVPCINPARTYSKNHDFGLRLPLKRRKTLLLKGFLGLKEKEMKHRIGGVPILKTERYFIQYRTPVLSIASNFKLHLRNFPGDDNREGWEEFARVDMAYWNWFIDKWVLRFPKRAVPPLYCRYEDLVAEPEARMREILQFFSVDPLDEKRFEAVLKAHPIEARNRISSFKFYDTGFFSELESKAGRRLYKLGLPSFEDGV